MGLFHADHRRRWAGAVVPYVLDERQFPAGSPARVGIDRVADYLVSTTGVRLVPRAGQRDHVRLVRAADRPSSYVGRLGGRQDLRCAIADLVIVVNAVRTYTDTSEDPPALAVEHTDGAGVHLLLAWRGEGNGWLNLGRAGAAGPVADKVTVEVECDQAPSVAVHRTPTLNAPDSFVAHCATSVGGRVAVFVTAPTTVGGTLPMPVRLVLSTGTVGGDPLATSTGVSVVHHAGRILLAWCDPDRRIVLADVLQTGPETGRVLVTDVLGETSESAPTLCSHGGSLYLAWRGLDDRVNVARRPVGATTFGDKATTEETTEGPVGLASAVTMTGPRPQLFAAWRSEDDAISFGRVRDAPGGGPVRVNQLWQQGRTGYASTSAAPAIAADGGTNSLTLAWVGSGNTSLNTAPVRAIGDEAFVHELGHALGLFHEHQRVDRDAFVRVVGPTDDEYEANFAIVPDAQTSGAYDLISRMHYPEGERLHALPPPSPAPAPSNAFSPDDLVALRHTYPLTSVLTLPFTTPSAPALGVLGAGEGVAVAWRDDGSDDLSIVGVPIELVHRPGGVLLPTNVHVPGGPLPVPYGATPAGPPALLSGADLAPGTPWAPFRLPERSAAGPGLAGTAMCWLGSGNDHLNVAGLGDGVVRWKVTLTDRSDHAPALARLADGFLLAWAGTDERLNLARLDGRGQVRARVTTAQTTDAAPALAATPEGRAYVAWKGTGNDRPNVAPVLVTATTVGLGATTTLTERCDPSTGPSLACLRHWVCIGWKGRGNEYLNIASSPDGGASFTLKHVSGERSPHAPALATFATGTGRLTNHALVVAWTGVGNDQVNVAVAGLQLP